MTKRKTTEEFIEDAKKVHGDKYDYSLVEYKNAYSKIKIICPIHGEFEQEASSHLRSNCNKCSIDDKKGNTLDFIEKSKNIYDNKYDYSLVEYITNNKKVKIICPEHGIFEQIPRTHISGSGCRLCYNDKRTKNTDFFIEKGNKIHNNKYDYSLVNYTHNNNKVKIICPIHGIFEQKPNIHLIGCGCVKCSIDDKKSNTSDFIEKCKKIHDNKYDYSLVEYETAQIKVKIICPEHGVFNITPHNHLFSKGCPKCHKSKNEIVVEKYLINKNIRYIAQKTFNDCIYKRKLPFDFYLPNHNICIEYDGQQHFNSISIWGGDEAFVKNKIRDEIKNEYCKNNNIRLIRIKYDENVEEKLNLILYS